MKRRVSNTCHSFILVLGEAHVCPFAVFSTGCQVTRGACQVANPVYLLSNLSNVSREVPDRQVLNNNPGAVCKYPQPRERDWAGLEATLSYKEDHKRILTQGCFYFHIQPAQRPCHNPKRCEGLGRLQSFWHK